MSLPQRIFRLFYRVLAYFIGFIVIYCVSPIVIVSLSPILLYRFILHKTSKWINPSLGKMVTSRGTIAALKNVYTSPRAKLAVGLVLEGRPSYETFHKGMKSTIELCDSKSTKLYPELTQSIVQWMGFPFWKPIGNFCIEDCLEFCDSSVEYNFDQALEHMSQEAAVPFEEGKALWKVIFIPKFLPNESEAPYFQKDKEYSFAILVIHHSLADGFSIIKLVYSLFQVSNPQANPTVKVNRSFGMNLLWPFILAMKIPYDIGMTLLKINKKTKVWEEKAANYISTVDPQPKGYPMLSKGRCADAASELIPFSIIRAIGKQHGVSSLSVIAAALTGAIRDVMFDNPKEIPSKVNLAIPFPLRDHPEKLRNHMSGGLLTLPIGESDVYQRLAKINSSIMQLKQSTIPVFGDWGGRLFGSLPPWMIKSGAKLLKSEEAVFLTSIPGPKEELKMLNDVICRETMWTNSGAKGTKVLAFSFTTYGGFGRLFVSSDFSLIESRMKADKIIKEFMYQLDSLSSSKLAQQEEV